MERTLSHRFVFRVEVEVDHNEGKFVSRDALCHEILDALEGADLGSMYAEESSYSISSWEVADVTDESNKRAKIERSLRAIKLHGERAAAKGTSHAPADTALSGMDDQRE